MTTISRLARMLFVLAVLLGMAATISAADFLVAAGTKLSVAFEQDVSSKYVKPGDLVPIKLVEPLEIGGQIVLKSGVKGSARVKSVSPAGRAGKAGKVEVELLELTAGEGFSSVDDKNIGLSGNDGPILVEGKGKKTLSWIFILGLFIKGGQGVVPADQPMAALVTDDVIVIVE